MANTQALRNHQDDQEWLSRSVQGMGHVTFPMDSIPIPAPQGISALSSLGKSEEAAPAPQHRPVLDKPSMMLELCGFLQGLETTHADSVQQLKGELKQQDAEIKEQEAARRKALEREIEATKSRDTWHGVSMVAQYAGSVGTITLGVATGGWGGFALVAAGLLGIGNRVLQDTNLLDPALAWLSRSEEQQKRIKETIDTGAFWLQIGFGVAGGYAAWQAASQGVSTVVMARKAAAAISTGSAIMGASTRVGKAVYDKRIANARATRAEIDLNITTANHKKTEAIQEASQLFEEGSRVNRVVHEAVQHLDVQVG